MSKRLLQTCVGILCCVPLSASLAGIVMGPATFGATDAAAAGLDSHFRYLSGLFLGIAIGFVSCIPGIETKGARFRALTACVVLGGLARAGSWAAVGMPEWPHLAGLGFELVATPALAFWQARLQRGRAS